MRVWPALLVLLAALLLLPGAGAQDRGPCEGTIAGAALTDDGQRIVVPEDGVVQYDFQAGAPVRSWDVQMSLGVTDVVVSEGTSESDETSVAGSAEVADYARYGAGLYEVDATLQLADGSTCTASVLLEVQRNPLTTAAGWVAITAGAGGIAMAAGGSAAAAKAALAALVKP